MGREAGERSRLHTLCKFRERSISRRNTYVGDNLIDGVQSELTIGIVANVEARINRCQAQTWVTIAAKANPTHLSLSHSRVNWEPTVSPSLSTCEAKMTPTDPTCATSTVPCFKVPSVWFRSTNGMTVFYRQHQVEFIVYEP